MAISNRHPAVRDAIETHRAEAVSLLSRLIQFPSTSGQEREAMAFLAEQFAAIPGVEVERIPLTDELRSDSEYSDPIPDLSYQGRFNLRVRRPGRTAGRTAGGNDRGGTKPTGPAPGSARTLLLNTHVDVVPPSDDMKAPWSGTIDGDVIHGRGACDAKGQVAAVYLLLRALAEMNASTGGDIICHLVVEEENGGNGTLAMMRRGERADGCVVLEPTGGALYTSIRGAVWFRLVFHGKAGHSGQAGQTRSALLLARDAMAALEGYHAELLSSSRGLPLFDSYPNPMPLTFGRLEAGNWPASAPSRAVLEGVLGFLPNSTREQVCRGIRDSLSSALGLLVEETPGEGGEGEPPGQQPERAPGKAPVHLHFMYRHDSSVVEPKHALPATLLAAAREAETGLRIAGMTASCDAWFYNNHLHIPTVVYGPGSLAYAHSAAEQITGTEIAVAAEVLARTALSYCGG